MILFDYLIEHGYILPFSALEAYLTKISSGAHQWSAQLIPRALADRHGHYRNYVAVGYTNPDIPHMPNMLCYLFPLVENELSEGVRPNALVCLHPTGAIPLTRGLYFEDDRLGADILEDWNRFWEPLGKELDRT